MNTSFKLKLFIAFFIYGILISSLSYLSLFGVDKVAPEYRALQTLNIKQNDINKFKQDINKKIISITNSYTLHKYISTKTKKQELASLFLDLTKSSSYIKRLRFIDKNAKAKVCVDRDMKTLKPFINKNCYNRKKSIYFKHILDEQKGKIYYSGISFVKNTKNFTEPILHVGTPIFLEDKKVGVLVMDILIKDFLYQLAKSDSGKIYIFDKDAKTLIDPEYINNWSSYLGLSSDLSSYFKQDAKNILNNNEYIGNNIYSKKMILTPNEVLHVVIKANTGNLQQEILKHSKELQIFMLSLILLSIPIAFIFAKIYSKQKKEDDKDKYNQDILLSLFDLSDVVLFKWNNDEKWSVDSVSKSVGKLLGYSQEDFESNKVLYTDCIHPDDMKQVTQEHVNSIRNRAYYFEHKPYRLIRNDGDIKWILHSTVIVRDSRNKITNFVGYLTDITELKNHEIELEKISRTDRLTGTNNRIHTDKVLENQYYRFKRDNETCSVILVDIDHFKSVNDTYGHLAGDNVLVAFSKVLQDSIRQGDVLGRWGGEEFLIILPHTNLDDAMQLGEKLRSNIEKYKFKKPSHITASFGVSTFEQKMDIDTLIDTADKGLYESKENGRNSVTTIQTEIESSL